MNNFEIKFKNLCQKCYRELEFTIEYDRGTNTNAPIEIQVLSKPCPDCQKEAINEIEEKVKKKIGDQIAKAFKTSFNDVD